MKKKLPLSLPPGWDFTPLYKHCPKCGCDLRKEFVAAESVYTSAVEIVTDFANDGVVGLAGPEILVFVARAVQL